MGNPGDQGNGFVLHDRLSADTLPVTDLALCRVLLMRNAAFPWLVLVPRRAGAVEMHRLDAGDRALLMEELAAAAKALEGEVAPDKINVGALGNLVSQLHIHVVARRRDDGAWPGPVWGSGVAVPYSPGVGEDLAARLARRLANAPAGVAPGAVTSGEG